MDSTPSTEEVMADTGPIFSIFPTSSSSTLEKIPVRRVWRALAVQRYSASPVSSSSRSIAAAVSSADSTARPASDTVIAGEAIFPKKPEIIPAKAARPASTASFNAVIRKIHLQRPFAIWRSVRFNSSITFLLPQAQNMASPICGIRSGISGKPHIYPFLL